MGHTITVREYEYLSLGKTTSDVEKTLSQSDFEALEKFILENNTEAVELMNLSIKKGIGKVITAKNYVGVLSLNSGTTIEVLPKIYSEEDTPDKAKKLLIQMLRTLRAAPYKSMQKTSVNIEKMNVFEIFIRMFIDEVFVIVKHGLKCNYERVEDNLNVFKGKINFAKHIKFNTAHKERCYVEYDCFDTNRAENRLIKSTLVYLYKKTASSKNKNDIRTLLNSFVDVCESENYANDFEKCISDRNMKGYTTALMWSKVFLQGKSFTSFSGSNVAFALLFPMETIFESYIASLIKKELDGKVYSFSAQDKSYHLFNYPKKIFRLRPDLVIRNKLDKSVFVMDTKWKVLSDNKSNLGISQADMYQMYAYQKKYNAKTITLLYPKCNEDISEEKLRFTSDDGVIVDVKFIDLYEKDSLKFVLNDILRKED